MLRSLLLPPRATRFGLLGGPPHRRPLQPIDFQHLLLCHFLEKLQYRLRLRLSDLDQLHAPNSSPGQVARQSLGGRTRIRPKYNALSVLLNSRMLEFAQI